MKKISEPNRVYMESKIAKEGFHYAFTGYSDFEEVEDERFHELRLNYLTAMNEFAVYMDLPKEYWA